MDLDINYTCLDMDSDPEQSTITVAPNNYETIYVTSHKAPCRAGSFTPDGRLIATGSADASIKILDVERMITKSIHHNSNNQNQNENSNPSFNNNDGANQQDGQNDDQPLSTVGGAKNGLGDNNYQNNQAAHPVIRTLYDHTDEVTYLQFHPSKQILASASLDMTIKFYDYMRASAKRAHKTLQEASQVRCFKFHPGGNYMLVACQQPTLRLYDVNTMNAYVSSNPLDQHTSPITMIDYNSSGSFYTTSSKDGDIKIWDGSSNRCINTLRRAHDGAEVTSIKVSRNGKYLLSSGKDNFVRLWEMSMSSCLMAYHVSNASSKNNRSQATFNHTEEYVIYPDSRNTSLHTWNSRTGEHLSNLALCHNNSVRFLVHSETTQAFLTCSEDYRARFWSIRDKGSA